MQIDEIRYKENYPPLGLNFVKLGLQDVLYNPETKEIYTPNTNKSTNIDNPNEAATQNAVEKPLEVESEQEANKKVNM